MQTQQALSDYLCRDLRFDSSLHLPSVDQPLLSSDGGVVDSVSLFRLVAFIESHFGIKVGDLEIEPENFETLGALIAFIERKRTACPPELSSERGEEPSGDKTPIGAPAVSQQAPTAPP